MKRQFRSVKRPNDTGFIPGVDDQSTIDTVDEQEYNSETSETTDSSKFSDRFISDSSHTYPLSQDSFIKTIPTVPSFSFLSDADTITDSSDIVFIKNQHQSANTSESD